MSKRFSILQAMESWVGPGNEATQEVSSVGIGNGRLADIHTLLFLLHCNA